jgi:hypothetical protein
MLCVWGQTNHFDFAKTTSGWRDMRKTVGFCGNAEPIDKWLTVGGWENPVLIAETPLLSLHPLHAT